MAVPQKTIHPRCEELVWNCQCPDRARMWHLTGSHSPDTGYHTRSTNLSLTQLPTRIRNSRKNIAIIDPTMWFVFYLTTLFVWHLKLVTAGGLCLTAGCVRSWWYPSWSLWVTQDSGQRALWCSELWHKALPGCCCLLFLFISQLVLCPIVPSLHSPHCNIWLWLSNYWDNLKAIPLRATNYSYDREHQHSTPHQ